MNRGSCGQPATPSSGIWRFNEAPIHESGKYPRPLHFHSLPVASMRPRFMNRGSNDRGGPAELPSASLQ